MKTKMIEICPAILTSSEKDFQTQVKEYVNLFKQIDIDINIEGDDFEGKVILSPEDVANEIKEHLRNKIFALHFMVSKPFVHLNKVLKILDKKDLKNLKIYIHQESSFKLEELNNLEELGIFVGISVRSESNLLRADFYKRFKEVQLMTVPIGYQGGDFIPEILYRVEWLRENDYKGIISVDGSVNLRTAEVIKDFSVDRVSVGSYFSKAEDVKLAKMKLELALNM